MNLLSKPQGPTIPIESRLRGQVAQIRSAPRRLAESIIAQWESAFNMLWLVKDGVTPAMRLEELGSDAAALFQANAALTQFLVSMLTGQDDELVAEITAKVLSIPPHTVHEDGTVTIDV